MTRAKPLAMWWELKAEERTIGKETAKRLAKALNTDWRLLLS